MCQVSDLIMKDNPKVEQNGGNEEYEERTTVEVLVCMPDRKSKVKEAHMMENVHLQSSLNDKTDAG